VKEILDSLSTLTGQTNFPIEERRFSHDEAKNIIASVFSFESVLRAELDKMHTYLVTPVRGLDPSTLIEDGLVVFPEDLPRKAKEAIGDLREAARCLAYGVYTACGYHLHRANEAVLHRYYYAIGGDPAKFPNNSSINPVVNELSDQKKIPENLKVILKHVAKDYRNPLVHPGDFIESADEAVALKNIIYSAMRLMFANMQPDNGNSSPSPSAAQQ
jgi:hypothetical protein